VFAQSHLPEHAELAWVLGCLTGFGEASRMTQFKEKGGGSVGLFTYPVLQAADILMYQADSVPIGEDQRQHLELTRDLAQRFNARYGETFTSRAVRRQARGAHQGPAGPGPQDEQDDRRHRHAVGARRAEGLTKKVKSAVTDTGARSSSTSRASPGISNLMTILAVATDTPVEALERDFDGKGYGDFKGAVAEAVVALFAPVRERYAALVADPAGVDAVLADGAARAREVAPRPWPRPRAVGLLRPGAA
jgi:tryptophanyl-tRNA synthetase